MKHTFFVAFLTTLLVASQPGLGAQAPKSYRGRLAPMPLDVAMQATMAGSGSMTALVSGSKLTLTGTFEGLKSPATVARLHKAQRGVRGPAVLDLQVTKATSGTISATIDLTPILMQDLQNSRLYVQLHSEKAPDGNLWGWLLPLEARR
jgi:hypothetical protein